MNGKIISQAEAEKIPASKIASITVIKNKKDPDYIKFTADAIKYANIDPTSIIKITIK